MKFTVIVALPFAFPVIVTLLLVFAAISLALAWVTVAVLVELLDTVNLPATFAFSLNVVVLPFATEPLVADKVIVVDALLIAIVLLPQALVLWFESPFTLTYTVVVPAFVLVGLVVLHVELSVLYCIVPPLPPLTVIVCALLSYVPLYALVVGHVASTLLIVIALEVHVVTLWFESPFTLTYTVVVPTSVLVGFVVLHVELSVLYCTVPPLPPLDVIVWLLPS